MILTVKCYGEFWSGRAGSAASFLLSYTDVWYSTQGSNTAPVKMGQKTNGHRAVVGQQLPVYPLLVRAAVQAPSGILFQPGEQRIVVVVKDEGSF